MTSRADLTQHPDASATGAEGIPTTMRVLRQTSLDGPQDMHLITDAPVPAPGQGEILIRVTAAGVNFADVMQTRGTYQGGPRPPYVAGFEAAGVVVALGDAVTGLKVGTRVAGLGYGAFAEYMVLPATAVAPVPAGWSDEQALGLVLNWATALAALRPLGRLAPDETVLIYAAAGGVGQAAVKMAKHYGATVIAAASPGKLDTVRALGADHVIDYRNTDVTAEVLRLTDGNGADLVLESAGGAVFSASLAAAKRVTGRVVVYGMAGGEAAVTNRDLNFTHQIHLIGLHIGVLADTAPQIFTGLMDELATLRAAGVVTPVMPTVYDLADGPQALMALESRTTIGKLALRP
ncbi:zinc-binding dehydrogenase [Dactylosporangium fulvum]|uniref:NADPH:quinone oxidoreductase family protein n=1 Tax=Dactylosporangium fulvum TaxID=53359 RepID=A0ABY5VRP0_9ACTN|nr:NADPH:quinone oxidoreductase family protein [Dactylosporangium fulvum]UWP79809.1 NADPH:quinone oxidoreductase family protein [Dactylosporangium fulvum]